MAPSKFKIDEDGFYLLSERIPEEYDLVLFKDQKDRTAPGWIANGKPEGMKVHYLDDIIKWRKLKHI